MSSVVEPEHPFPDIVGFSFFEDADVVYGADSALAIGATIVLGAERARALLPFADFSSTKLRLAVMRPPAGHDRDHAAHMWASSDDDIVNLMCNPDAMLGEVINDLRMGLPHEFGHLAHHQVNPNFGDERTDYELFAAAIKEGVARCVEFSSLDSIVEEEHWWRYRKDEELSAKVSRFLTADTASEGVVNVLYGRDKEMPCAYYVGHFVVSSLGLYRIQSIQELMQTPLSEYIDFAQAELT